MDTLAQFVVSGSLSEGSIALLVGAAVFQLVTGLVVRQSLPGVERRLMKHG